MIIVFFSLTPLNILTSFLSYPNSHMLFFLISYCFCFLFLFKSFLMKSEWGLLLGPNRFWSNFSSFLVSLFQKGSLAISFYYQFLTLTKMPILLRIKKMDHHHYHGSKLQETITMEEEEEEDDDQFAVSLLDLPDLALESILERLSPSGLCRMATVCKSLRESCASDHLWKNHLEVKWGRVVGAAAFREWEWHMVSLMKRSRILDQENEKSLLRSVIGSSLWPFSWSKKENFESKGQGKPTASSFTADSIMDLYLSLENGKFWFPAQVYNREDGHVGFLLSCYDAELSYDSKTDTFQARYFPFGRHATERNINWDRLRAPPVDTPPASVLHVSDCLNDLKPDDHIEIQWRRSKVFPYGWWYGAVGHLEPCDGNENRCCCESNDMVVLEFNQYTPGSQWRRMKINRKDHREEGYKADGFYGGIRKLYNEKEISKWKQLWPRQQFE